MTDHKVGGPWLKTTKIAQLTIKQINHIPDVRNEFTHQGSTTQLSIIAFLSRDIHSPWIDRIIESGVHRTVCDGSGSEFEKVLSKFASISAKCNCSTGVE